MRPTMYRIPHIVMQDTSFTLVNEQGEARGVPQTGMFGVGRVIWMPRNEQVIPLAAGHIIAWAEGAGLVSVSRNSLAKAA